MAKRKSQRKKLMEKTEKVLKEFIVARDASICQHCGKLVTKQNRHLSHVISRKRSPHLKYDEQNVKILCYNCHMNWWHKDPIEAGEWFKSKFPDRWKYLESRKNETIKLTETDLENYIEYYSKN